jgi:ATP-dependent Lon protease
VDDEARVGLFRLEVTLTAGTGKVRTPTGLEKGLKESLNRAFSYLQGVRDRLGLTPVLAQKDIYTVILGDLTIQGNIKGPASIIEPLQLALDNGALRVLLPVANKSQFAGLPEDVVQKLDLVFYGDVDRAVLKTLEL